MRAEIERIASSGDDDDKPMLVPKGESDGRPIPVSTSAESPQSLDSPPRLQVEQHTATDNLVDPDRPVGPEDIDSDSPLTEELDDVEVLMNFYRRVEPAFANQQKVERIVDRFRSRTTAPGENWRDLMYDAIAKQRGVDPRDSAAVATTLPDDTSPIVSLVSTQPAIVGERSPATSSMRAAWTDQRNDVELELGATMLACAQARLHWARVVQRWEPARAAGHPKQLSPIAVLVSNALGAAVVVQAARSLAKISRREILSLREMKRMDSSSRSAGGSKRRQQQQQHYDDEEAVKVMRQVRAEVAVLSKEMSASHQQIKSIDLERIFESLGNRPRVRRSLQSVCATAVESSGLVAQLRLQKKFGWGVSDGDCVALMEDFLVRVEDIKAEKESAELSRREAAMMGARRAGSLSTGVYELLREAAVRSHPGCLSNWVGTVAAGERVRLVKIVSDNSGILFAKVDEDGLLGWIALGPRPGDDEKPVMKRIPKSQVSSPPAVVGTSTPPSRSSSTDEPLMAATAQQQRNSSARKPQQTRGSQKGKKRSSGGGVGGQSSSTTTSGNNGISHSTGSYSSPSPPPSTTPPPGDAVAAAAASPADGDREKWARKSTQAERLAALRHELGRETVASPGTRSLENKLHALEAQLGTLSGAADGGERRNDSREMMRASWSPNATVASSGSPPTVEAAAATAAAAAARRRQQGTTAKGCIEGSWGIEEVVDWLVSVGLGEYARAFTSNSMDGEALIELERWRRRAYDGYDGPPGRKANEGSLFADCLRGLGISKTGHVLKLCRHLAAGVDDAGAI